MGLKNWKIEETEGGDLTFTHNTHGPMMTLVAESGIIVVKQLYCTGDAVPNNSGMEECEQKMVDEARLKILQQMPMQALFRA